MGASELGAVIPIVAIIVGGAIMIFRPLAQAHSKQMAGQRPAIPPEVSMRLERIEQAVEAIALEVERVTEGQRFITKVLAETPPPALAASRAAAAVSDRQS